jgi:hypothetical protein
VLNGALGAPGTVEPIEAAYYRPILRRIDGVWKIATMRITLNIPMALPVSNSGLVLRHRGCVPATAERHLQLSCGNNAPRYQSGGGALII